MFSRFLALNLCFYAQRIHPSSTDRVQLMVFCFLFVTFFDIASLHPASHHPRLFLSPWASLWPSGRFLLQFASGLAFGLVALLVAPRTAWPPSQQQGADFGFDSDRTDLLAAASASSLLLPPADVTLLYRSLEHIWKTQQRTENKTYKPFKI